MVITGYVAFVAFGVIAFLLRRRGAHWFADFFVVLAALAIASTSVGLWLHVKSSEGLNLAVTYVVNLFH